jgi:2-polyprenylphenol 6-hydroxylase
VSERFEVVVVGGGLVGACAAALLARHTGLPGARIALITSELPPRLAGRAPPELRIVAVSRASERVLEAAGAWQRLDPQRLCRYERMRVWTETASIDSADALSFDAADLGEPDLGSIIENGALQHACIDSARDAGAAIIVGSVAGLELQQDGARLQLLAPSQPPVIGARLVVGADGARSKVREAAQLPVRVRDYHQLALVANVRTAHSHEHTAWQRFLRTGPLALLPLFDGSCSIVWSVDEPSGRPLLECAVEEFNRRLEMASDAVLGTMRLVSERVSFPLHSVAALSYIAPRCALIGDAAHVIHPLAGQGANLGLLDAAALCEAVGYAVTEHEDPGALRALRRYEQRRRTHNLAMDAAMSAFQQGLALPGPAAWLAQRALGVASRSSALKGFFARRALGLSGELPPLAR